jgi:hypothetical protein
MKKASWSVGWEPALRAMFDGLEAEAATLGNDWIGTQHLLLAALASAPFVEEKLGRLTRDSVRAAIVAVADPQERGGVTLTPWCQTPRFKRAVEHAMRRAFTQSRPVACRDIWHGLLADRQSVCARALAHLDIDVEQLRELVA